MSIICLKKRPCCSFRQ